MTPPRLKPRPEFLSTGQAGRICGLSPATIINRIKDGTLPCSRIGNGPRILSRADVEEYAAKIRPQRWIQQPITPEPSTFEWKQEAKELASRIVAIKELVCDDIIIKPGDPAWSYAYMKIAQKLGKA